MDAERVQSQSALTRQGTEQTAGFSAGDAPLDDQALAQLRALRRPGRPDPVAKILACFLEDSVTYMRAIQAAVSHQDAKALFQAAHAMKSMSAMIGAVRLSNILRDLEHMGRHGTVARDQVTMAELELIYEAVKQAVLDELRKEAA